jgi:hypothetical protein
MTRKMPGVVAAVLGPQDTAATCEAATERVIRAAVAEVAAWRDCNEGEGYLVRRRLALLQAQRELAAAVEGLGDTTQGGME